MLVPVMIIAFGVLGLCLCLFLILFTRSPAANRDSIKDSPVNHDVDLKRYKPTVHPEIFIDRALPDHPFRLVKDGIFCGVCLITHSMRHAESVGHVHTHACTVIRKEWKILICKDAVVSEYFVSLGKPHFRKR